ncbi:MAG: DUF1330 domain-containing protein [Proteobacteria bacterium]|nr:DUF1330 domain-containing protein [Pseudomonadota bacterium]
MSAFIIVDANVHDPEAFKAYGAKVGATLKAHGGKPVASSTDTESLEGTWNPSRVVILEFADADAARGWYNSPEYQEIIPLRQAAATDSLVLVPGL